MPDPAPVTAPEKDTLVPVTPVVPVEPVTPSTEELSNEDLDKKINEGFTKPEAPVEAPKPVTPPTETPKAPEAPVSPEKVYAGKYKTEADLEKGTLSVAKQLGYDERAIKMQLEIAKESKDFTQVEKLYKRMETEIGKPKAPESVPVTETPKPVTADDSDFSQSVTHATFEALETSPEVREMRDAGFQIPRTTEEFKELINANGYYANLFRQAFREKFKEFYTEGQAYQKALGEVETVNKQTTESETTKLREFAAQNGLTLSDNEISETIAEAMKSPVIFEQRHGVNFIRDNALVKFWLAEKFPGKLEEVKLSIATRSRTEAIEDLKKLQAQVPGSISTTPISGARQTERPKLDLTKDSDAKTLNDEDLNAEITKRFKGD